MFNAIESFLVLSWGARKLTLLLSTELLSFGKRKIVRSPSSASVRGKDDLEGRKTTNINES